MGWTVLGRWKNQARMAFCVNPWAMCSQRPVDNAERLVPRQRVEVGQVQGRVVIALHLGLQRLTATTAVSPACEHPSRRQMFCAIPGVIADQQANRILRWQAAIGGCRANATAPGKGATD